MQRCCLILSDESTLRVQAEISSSLRNFIQLSQHFFYAKINISGKAIRFWSIVRFHAGVLQLNHSIFKSILCASPSLSATRRQADTTEATPQLLTRTAEEALGGRIMGKKVNKGRRDGRKTHKQATKKKQTIAKRQAGSLKKQPESCGRKSRGQCTKLSTRVSCWCYQERLCSGPVTVSLCTANGAMSSCI